MRALWLGSGWCGNFRHLTRTGGAISRNCIAASHGGRIVYREAEPWGCQWAGGQSVLVGGIRPLSILSPRKILPTRSFILNRRPSPIPLLLMLERPPLMPCFQYKMNRKLAS